MTDTSSKPPQGDRFVPLSEICVRLGNKHRTTIYRMQRRGELKLRRCARNTGMLESELSLLLERLPFL
jgi:hypothetical protein